MAFCMRYTSVLEIQAANENIADGMPINFVRYDVSRFCRVLTIRMPDIMVHGWEEGRQRPMTPARKIYGLI